MYSLIYVKIKNTSAQNNDFGTDVQAPRVKWLKDREKKCGFTGGHQGLGLVPLEDLLGLEVMGQ